MFLSLGCSHVAFSAVTVLGTRVIYNSTDRDVTVQLSNAGPAPALVQAWVDLGDPAATPESIDAPFVLSPPMFRIDPNHKQNLRLVFTGRELPKDRETVFWLNVLEIPPKPGDSADENYLQFSVRSRLKIFFRPAQLKGDPNRAVESLSWQYSRQGNSIKVVVNNPTPFHVSFAEINLSSKRGDKGDSREAKTDSTNWISQSLSGMVKPLSVSEFVFFDVDSQTSMVLPIPLSVHYSVVNDWGGYVSSQAPILLSQPDMPN
jgi:P pilus assembly chaperone PapD